MKKRKQTDSEKLDLILANTIALNEKVEQQNSEIASLKQEVKSLEVMVNQMAKKHRVQSFVAGGIGGALVATGFELLRLKLGG